jgi:hypothetical protein
MPSNNLSLCSYFEVRDINWNSLTVTKNGKRNVFRFCNVISRCSRQWRSHLSQVGPLPTSICDSRGNVCWEQQSYSLRLFYALKIVAMTTYYFLLLDEIWRHRIFVSTVGATWRWHFVLTLRYSFTAPSSLMIVHLHAWHKFYVP